MFVVCGEALMDVFGGADSAHGLMLDVRIGGSPLNVAAGLVAQPVAFFGGPSASAPSPRWWSRWRPPNARWSNASTRAA